MPARIDDLLVLDTAVSKTDLAKYLRDRETVLPSDFGRVLQPRPAWKRIPRSSAASNWRSTMRFPLARGKLY